jgi:hypothetical protein
VAALTLYVYMMGGLVLVGTAIMFEKTDLFLCTCAPFFCGFPALSVIVVNAVTDLSGLIFAL